MNTAAVGLFYGVWKFVHLQLHRFKFIYSGCLPLQFTFFHIYFPNWPRKYSVFFLCNGLYVFSFHASCVMYSEVFPSRWRFVTMPNQSYDYFSCWTGLRCNCSYLVRPRLSFLEYSSFIHFLSCREEVRRAAYAGKCHYIYPITCIWFKWYLAPSAIFIAGVFA